jgi:hypothetical protein
LDLSAVARLADSDFNVRQEAKSELEFGRALHEIAAIATQILAEKQIGALARMR